MAMITLADSYMAAMGQELFAPPTVAGWGQNAYWLSTARTWGKAAFAAPPPRDGQRLGSPLADTPSMAPADAATRAFAQFGIVPPAGNTRRVVEGYITKARAAKQGGNVPADLVQLILMSPDFQLA